MTLNFLAGAAATTALFVPVLLVLYGRLFKNGSLLALFTYYLLAGLYNAMTLEAIPVSPVFLQNSAVVFNYLDTLLMLLVLLFFCNTPNKRRMVLYAFFLFAAFEAVIAFLYGLNVDSSTYILGPGTLLILSLSMFFFAQYGKLTVVKGKGRGKTLMLVSLLFSYGCFLVLYYLHYLLKTPAVADVFFIYYIVTFIATVVMSLGLVWVIKRTREINERQTTRKELALFFYK
jgi:hypothetical protein